MSEVFLGQIMMSGYGFATKGFAFCNGQTLPIAQNQALFSLLTTMYGGNGTTTFCLPDLRGRAPTRAGPSAVTNPLPPMDQGQFGGTENVTLTVEQLPQHAHQFLATGSVAGDTRVPTNAVLATTTVPLYGTPGAVVQLDTRTCSAAGNSQPHANMQPYLTINFCVALAGVYPSRD